MTSPATTSIASRAVTSSSATKVTFSIDSEQRGQATTGSPTFDWIWTGLSTVSDATYLVSAQATNAQGRTGQARIFSITLNRTPGPAPTTSAGAGTCAWAPGRGWPRPAATPARAWTSSRRRSADRAASASASSATRRTTRRPPLVCDITLASSTDDSPAAIRRSGTASTLYYWVASLDRDPTTATRRTATASRTALTATTDNRVPTRRRQ